MPTILEMRNPISERYLAARSAAGGLPIEDDVGDDGQNVDERPNGQRDPVRPARRSAAAERKVASKINDTGQSLHSFQTLLGELAGIVRNTCRTPGSGETPSTFEITTTSDPVQQRALDLAAQIRV